MLQPCTARGNTIFVGQIGTIFNFTVSRSENKKQILFTCRNNWVLSQLTHKKNLTFEIDFIINPFSLKLWAAYLGRN